MNEVERIRKALDKLNMPESRELRVGELRALMDIAEERSKGHAIELEYNSLIIGYRYGYLKACNAVKRKAAL